MTTRARRAQNRKAERARVRRSVRFAMAALRREYGPEFELFRVEQACPCGHCGLAFGRGGTLHVWTLIPAEARAVHDAHLARLLALWELRVWRPERAAAGWLRLVLATVRLRAAVRVLVAAGLRRARAAVSPLSLPAVELATSLDLSPPLIVATFAGGAAMPP